MLALGSTHQCWFVDGGVGSCWFGVMRFVSADMGYARQGLQERERGGGWGQAGELSMVGIVSREWQ